MPIFLVPVLIGGASLIAGGAGAVLLKQAWDAGTQARDRYDTAQECLKTAKVAHLADHKKTTASVQSLDPVATSALATLQDAIRFLEKAKAKHRDISATWDGATVNAQAPGQPKIDLMALLKQARDVAGTHAAVTTGLTTLATTVGVASTGVAIGSLSGAAATSAVLAWLGGGALAVGGGGMALGSAVLGAAGGGAVTFSVGLGAKTMVEKFKTDTERAVAEIDTAIAAMRRTEACWRAVQMRIEELKEALGSVSHSLRKCIESSNPSSSSDVYRVYSLAKSLADILDNVQAELKRLQGDKPGAAA